MIAGVNACDAPSSSILFKSRTAGSLSSQKKDYNDPYPFGGIKDISVSIYDYTLDCANPEV